MIVTYHRRPQSFEDGDLVHLHGERLYPSTIPTNRCHIYDTVADDYSYDADYDDPYDSSAGYFTSFLLYWGCTAFVLVLLFYVIDESRRNKSVLFVNYALYQKNITV